MSGFVSCPHWIQAKGSTERWKCRVVIRHKIHKVAMSAIVGDEKPFPGSTVVEVSWRDD